MPLNDAQLGIGDGNLFRPIVRDPDFHVRLSAGRLPALRQKAGIVLKVEPFGPAARGAAATFAMDGHALVLPRDPAQRKPRIMAS